MQNLHGFWEDCNNCYHPSDAEPQVQLRKSSNQNYAPSPCLNNIIIIIIIMTIQIAATSESHYRSMHK